MKTLHKLLLLSLLVLPVACGPDDDDYRPEKTERGSDRFDVRIGGESFTDGHAASPSSVVVSDGKLCLSLYGDIKTHKEWDSKWERRTLTFTIPLDTLKLDKFSDLVLLDSMEVWLKDSCLIEWKKDFRIDTLNATSGWLKFNRSKLIGLDGERNSVFLSGEFDFRYEGVDSFDEDYKHKDSLSHRNYGDHCDGWFDLVVTRSNFEKK